MSDPLHEGFEWSYRDFLTALLIAFVALSAISLLAKSPSAVAVFPPGTVLIAMHWDAKSNSDTDLWVQSPLDEAPVGFSHPADRNCNLLRDDLGRMHDPESQNFELIVCRQSAPGPWVADVNMWISYDDQWPVIVAVNVVEITPAGKAVKIAEKSVDLGYRGQTKVAVRWSLGRDGAVIPGSIAQTPFLDLINSSLASQSP